MKPPVEDIENRRLAWEALSDLFLDTELEAQDHWRIAEVLFRSPYSVDEMEQILYGEVYPACIVNLHQTAGEWQGISVEWIEGRVKENAKKPWKRWRILQVSRWMIRNHWKEIRTILESMGPRSAKP